MRLLDLPIGKRANISEIALDSKTKNRLQNIGLIVGCEVALVRNNFGDVVVKVRECRVAMNKEVAKNIIVEVCNEEVTTDETV